MSSSGFLENSRSSDIHLFSMNKDKRLPELPVLLNFLLLLLFYSLKMIPTKFTASEMLMFPSSFKSATSS